MKTDTQHTPGPWFLSQDYKRTIRAQGSGPGVYIATMCGEHGCADANAAYIVKCVNSHAANLARIAQLENLLKDAAFNLERLTGENLAIYAPTFAALAGQALASGKEGNQ